MQRVRIVLHGTQRPVEFCPVASRVRRSIRELKGCALVDVARGQAVPFQIEPETGGARLHWIVDSIAARQDKEYLLQEPADRPASSQVVVASGSDGRVDVRIGGELLTRYIYGGDVSKPCLYPLIGPFGRGVTRAYPQEEVEGDSTDHIHHRSFYVAWGDVNGSNNWSEEEGSGRMVHRYFETMEGGPVLGRIVALNDWVDVQGNRLMQDRLEYVFYNVPPSFRLLDLSVTFYASEGDVRLGDTKEGGVASLRVASSMEAGRGGRIENALGAVNEAETWGKRASWCDYSGPVGDHVVGIAVFDHPSNLRYPTYWHVRDYGLMTANPFGLSSFVGEGADGSCVVPSGQHLCFRYRVLIHAGGAREGNVGRKYLDWIFPPSATVQD